MTTIQEPEGLKGNLFEKKMHDSAVLHCTGRAVYVDDVPEPADTLQLFLGYSPHAKAKINAIDVSKALTADGVVTILTVKDIAGANDFGHAHLGDDLVLADGEVNYEGQVVFCVAAETIEQAKHAANLVNVEYEVQDPIITIDQAIEANSMLMEPMILEDGDADQALKNARHRLTGRIEMGAQEQFYLESQNSLAIPQDQREMRVLCSTQDGRAKRVVVRCLPN